MAPSESFPSTANLPLSPVFQGTPGAVLDPWLITHGFPHISAHGLLTQETSSKTPEPQELPAPTGT